MSMPRKSLGLLLTKWLSDGVVYIKDCAQMYEPSKQLGHLLSVLSQNISLGGYRSTHVM